MSASTGNDIGARLRLERQARGISLRKVAKDLGVSASLISQVETGKTQPSVSTLYSLASLMSISVDELLGLPTDQLAFQIRDVPNLDLQRGADNPVIEMENGVRWERLAMESGGSVDSLLVTYQPGGSSSLEGKLMRHAGSEYVYMLDGEITLHLEFDSYVLGRGDSVHFDSSRPHMFSNHGSIAAIGTWFVVGRRDDVALTRGKDGFSRAPSARSALEVLARLDPLE